MCARILIVLIMLLFSTLVFSKKNTRQIIETQYAISLSQISTGSGHGVGYTINGSIIKGKKALEAGLIYNEKESRISGGDFKYQIILGDLNRIQSDKKLYIPYLQFNLVYRNGMSNSPDVLKLGSETYSLPSKPGMISTMGHYLAYGNKIRLFNRVYFDTSLGFGFYLGSLDKVNDPDTFGIHYGNSGFTYAFKVGFGYAFK